MRLTPAGCQGLGSGAAALISPTTSSLLAVDRDNSHGAAADLGEESPRRRNTGRTGWGRLLVGRRLGFGAREQAAGIRFRGRVVAIRGTSAAGRGGGHGGPARLASCPAPPRDASRDKAGKGKR
jgi:hypothetical protein